MVIQEQTSKVMTLTDYGNPVKAITHLWVCKLNKSTTTLILF